MTPGGGGEPPAAFDIEALINSAAAGDAVAKPRREVA